MKPCSFLAQHFKKNDSSNLHIFEQVLQDDNFCKCQSCFKYFKLQCPQAADQIV